MGFSKHCRTWAGWSQASCCGSLEQNAALQLGCQSLTKTPLPRGRLGSLRWWPCAPRRARSFPGAGDPLPNCGKLIRFIPLLLCPSWWSGPWCCAVRLLFLGGKFVSEITDDLITPPPPIHIFLQLQVAAMIQERAAWFNGNSLPGLVSHLNPSPCHDPRCQLAIDLVVLLMVALF